MISGTHVIRMVITTVVSVGAVMTAAGCITRVPDRSLSPSASTSVSASTSTSTSVSVRPGTSPSEAGPAPSGSRSGGPTTSQLRQVLLTPADLSGFTTGQDSDDTASSPGCAALDSDFSAGSSASAEVLLTSSSGVLIRERLRQLSEPDARAAVSRIRGAVAGCATFTDTGSPLGKMNVTVTALSQPAHGDETAALRLTIRPESVNLTLFENLVAVRHGGTLLLLTQVSPLAIDDGLTASATGKAYTKLATLW